MDFIGVRMIRAWTHGPAKGSARVLLVKLSGLFSFCGGPLFVADLMKPDLGTAAFVLSFAPVGIALGSAFSLWEAHPGNWGRAAVGVGIAGILVVLAMNFYAGWRLATGPANPDGRLHQFGILVGFVVAAPYLYFGAKRLSR